MIKERVSARKRDRDDNPVGLANSNPILDTCSYIVNFDDGNQTELTANLITESLFSQCDPDGNQYVLLDEIIDHQRLSTAIPLADQKVVHAPTVRPTLSTRPLVGKYAANGRTAPHPGKTLVTYRNSIPLRPPNMPRSLVLTMNQLSTGGSLISLKRETGLSRL